MGEIGADVWGAGVYIWQGRRCYCRRLPGGVDLRTAGCAVGPCE